MDIVQKLNNATKDNRFTSGQCLIMYDLDGRIQFVQPKDKGYWQEIGYTQYIKPSMPHIPPLAGTITEPKPAQSKGKPTRKKASNEQV